MMDKCSLIGLGCFKIFKGNTLWMRLRGLTIQPLFEEWVVDTTTSKNSDLGCSIDGFKYPVPTCYTPTTSIRFIPTKKGPGKTSQKITRKNLKGTNPPQIPSLFFQLDSQSLQTLQPKSLPLGGKLGGKMPSTSPFAHRLSILIVGSGCGSEAKRLQPKRFHLGVQNVRRYAKSLSGVVFFSVHPNSS